MNDPKLCACGQPVSTDAFCRECWIELSQEARMAALRVAHPESFTRFTGRDRARRSR